MTAGQRIAAHAIVDLQRRLELSERRQERLERDLGRARAQVAELAKRPDPRVVRSLKSRLYQQTQRAEMWRSRAMTKGRK